MEDEISCKSFQSDKVKKKNRNICGHVIMLVFGITISVMSFRLWYNPSKIKSFEPPDFEQLTISSGITYFNKSWKGSGETTNLLLDNGKSLKLGCGGPFTTTGCYYVNENGKWVNREMELIGERVKVWWLPLKGHDDQGTIYQIEVKGKIFFSYKDKKEEYLNDFQRGNPNKPYLFILFSFIFVLVPTIKLIKEVKK